MTAKKPAGPARSPKQVRALHPRSDDTISEAIVKAPSEMAHASPAPNGASFPQPLPENPMLTSEQLNQMTEKTAAIHAKQVAGVPLSLEEQEEWNQLLNVAEMFNLDADSLAKQAEQSTTTTHTKIEQEIRQGMGLPVKAKRTWLSLGLNVLSYIGVGALGAAGGVMYERYRSGKSVPLLGMRGGNTGAPQLAHSDSPNSHPATSPLDGRHFNHEGNPGNAGNTTNHPNTGGRQRANA